MAAICVRSDVRLPGYAGKFERVGYEPANVRRRCYPAADRKAGGASSRPRVAPTPDVRGLMGAFT